MASTMVRLPPSTKKFLFSENVVIVLVVYLILTDSPQIQPTSSTIGGGRGCDTFVPVLGGKDMTIAPTGDIFY